MPINPYENGDQIRQVFVQPTYLNFSDGTHESDEGGEFYEPYSKNNDGPDQPKLLTGKEKI